MLSSEMSAADLAAVVGGANRNDGGFGFGGDNGWWILLLFLCLFNGGWGGNYGGGSNGGAGGLYPWMNQAEITSDGFRDQMLNNNITSIRDSIGNLSTQLCNCCSDMQMANMNSAFGIQNALNQGFTSVNSNLAQYGFDNRLGTADLKYTIATENCADRAALSEGIRDIIAAQNAGFQSIKDQICQDKIDQKNDTIAQLRQELLYSRGQASQDVQTATLRSGLQTANLELLNELRSCPIPSMPVYGQTPIFSCNNGCGCNAGCGCGM